MHRTPPANRIRKTKEISHPSDAGPFCPQCGYNRYGSRSNRCPECGITNKEVRWRERFAEFLYEVRSELRGESLRRAGAVAGFVMILAGFATIMMKFCHIADNGVVFDDKLDKLKFPIARMVWLAPWMGALVLTLLFVVHRYYTRGSSAPLMLTAGLLWCAAGLAMYFC